MANRKANGGTHELKETYADEIVAIARLEQNIYNDFSTDYEKDEVTGQVKVPTRDGEVQLTEYDVVAGVELTTSKTEYIDMPMDIEYAVNELIDGYEAEAVPDNIRAQRIESAGASMGEMLEGKAIDALVDGGTESPETGALTEANVYKAIASEIKNMKKRGMKVGQMRVAVDAETEYLLLTDEKFSNTAGALGAELVREGVIGKINGVAVKPNYFLPDEVAFVVYDRRYTQKVETWKIAPAINGLADGKHVGASALQGRIVAGVLVTNALGVQVRKNA